MAITSLEKSQSYRNRAELSIAHGALTNSKRPQSFVEGIYPSHLKSGHGCKVIDADDNEYVDYICSLGAILLGHNAIIFPLIQQLAAGSVLSLSSTLEVEYAERIQGLFPYMERIRILKTGSEACTAALRIARAYTGRKHVLSEGYHGWHDEFVSLTPPARGVAGEFSIGKLYHPRDILPAHAEPPAAIIIEPVITDYSRERIEWLKELRAECTKHNVLLIFDETITGCRFPGLSVANATGIEPDISILGKALGGGFPISVVGGRARIMESDYFISSTFAGDLLALRASFECLGLLSTRQYNIKKLWEMGAKFQESFNGFAPDVLKIEGYPTRGVFKGPENTEINKALFFQEACRAGFLFGSSWFINFKHDTEVHRTLEVCRNILKRIERNEVRLEGKLPQAPFAEKVRQQ